MVFDLTDILPALPEMLLASLALALVLVAAFGGEGAKNSQRVTRISLGGILVRQMMKQPLVACTGQIVLPII